MNSENKLDSSMGVDYISRFLDEVRSADENTSIEKMLYFISLLARMREGELCESDLEIKTFINILANRIILASASFPRDVFDSVLYSFKADRWIERVKEQKDQFDSIKALIDELIAVGSAIIIKGCRVDSGIDKEKMDTDFVRNEIDKCLDFACGHSRYFKCAFNYVMCFAAVNFALTDVIGRLAYAFTIGGYV